MEKKDIIILGIESSCDDTSAAVIRNGVLLSNVTASQAVHEAYGGVVPELASRAHQQNVVPVVDQALKRAGVTKEELSAVAFTRGPGLMGSLLVGVSFAKGFARALGIPMIEVNHLQGHVLAHFIKEDEGDHDQPEFPFLCLLVSGGNSQIILVKAYNDMEVLGQTIDDAAGGSFCQWKFFSHPGAAVPRSRCPCYPLLLRKGNYWVKQNKRQPPGRHSYRLGTAAESGGQGLTGCVC